jgi:hypothetical protein
LTPAESSETLAYCVSKTGGVGVKETGKFFFLIQRKKAVRADVFVKFAKHFFS